MMQSQQQRPHPPSSLAFPELSPEIPNQDDRLIVIQEHIHRTLTDNLKQTNANTALEIEAKLGQIIFNPDKITNQAERELMTNILGQKYWQILFPQKRSSGGSYYEFRSGIASVDQSQISNSELFSRLQQKFSEQCTKNPNLIQSYEKTKDVQMKLGAKHLRATYVFNQETQQYDPQPKELLNKDRINDLNVKKGSENMQFKSDFRISASFEHQLPQQDLQNHITTSVRVKDRYKYKFIKDNFVFLIFDLTKTVQVNHHTNQQGEEQYEVEIEVGNIDYFQSNMQNPQNFNMIICRYLQNIAAVMKLVQRCKEDAVREKFAQEEQKSKHGDEILQRYTAQSIQNYRQYYHNAPMPIVGDYLAAVATKMLSNQEQQNQMSH